MSDRATSVSPGVLIWARERAGLSLADVAVQMHKSEDAIRAWESGDAWPTYNQLEQLAESLYRRPVALFFLPEPPEEPAPQQEFRTLPDFDVGSLAPQTRYVIRLARAHQQSLRELTGGVNPSARNLLRDIHTGSMQTDELTSNLRTYLGVSLRRQKNARTMADAMAMWRGSVERAGIYVFKQPLKQRAVSGFCLGDEQFPIIMVNNSTPFTRQIFTLLHEVAHLLYGVNSITTVDGSFVERMTEGNRSVEIACNRLAADTLVPPDEFPWAAVDTDSIGDSVSGIAWTYKVSREVVLRRVLDRGVIDSTTYRNWVAKWAEEGDSDRDGEGGNYYYNQAAYLGDAFLRLAFSRYHAGVISISDLAEHLHIKAKNIPRFEDVVFGRL